MSAEQHSDNAVAFAPGYFVTPDGRVFSTKTGSFREMQQTTSPTGYRAVCLGLPSGQRGFRVHRLVAMQHGAPGHGPLVCHRDGDRSNNHIDNLYWGTAKDNAADRERHGRTARGKRCGVHTRPERVARGEKASNAKLTQEQVVSIRRRVASGESAMRVARADGLNYYTVWGAATGRTWAHLPDAVPALPRVPHD